MTHPDPSLMVRYCEQTLPQLLVKAGGMEPELADRIGQDVLARAEAFASLSYPEQDVLTTPFVEEVFEHNPLDTSLDFRAKVTVVVRNSLLEEAHHDGFVPAEGIVTLTQHAVGPLSHFVAARHRHPTGFDGANAFAGLAERYPRAWACLSSLNDALAQGGGRMPLRLPSAPMPELPAEQEIVKTQAASHNQKISIFSGINERFDAQTVDTLRQAMEGDLMLGVSALSRYSRNSAKLHRILDFLLAYGATILTTNYLIRPTEVSVRRGQPVKPVTNDPRQGFVVLQGLSGVHRKLAETVAAQLR